MSWLCRKITCQSKYSVWIKLLYSGNGCLKELSKSMPSFKPSEDRRTVLLGGNVAGCKWNPLRCDTVRTPGPSSTSVSTYCQYTTGAIRCLLELVARSVKWRSTVRLIRSFMILLTVDNVPRHPLFFLVFFIPISKWCFALQRPLRWSNTWIKELQQLLRPTTWWGPLPSLLLQLRKTWIQLWMDLNICDCIQKLAWAWDDVTKGHHYGMNGRWNSRGLSWTWRDLPRLRGCKALAEAASNWNLGVDEDDIEELLEGGS